MEKYCPKCRRVFPNESFLHCPNCGTLLNEREGRQHIPGHLRHKVFQRDGYRCVECGATSKETTLEIDHIIPVSRGGTNDIDNLQTLCKECNRAKSNTFWGNPIDIKKNELELLEKTLIKLKKDLELEVSGDKKIDIKYRIEVTKEKINRVKQQIDNLKTKEFKEKLYKRLYVYDKRIILNIINDSALGVPFYSNLSYQHGKDYILKFLLNNVSLFNLQVYLDELDICIKKVKNLNSKDFNKLVNHFSVDNNALSRQEQIDYIFYNNYYTTVNKELSRIHEDNLIEQKKREYTNQIRNLNDDVFEVLCSHVGVPKHYEKKDEKISYIIRLKPLGDIPNKIKEAKNSLACYDSLNSLQEDVFNILSIYCKVPDHCVSKDDKIRYLIYDNSFFALKYLFENSENIYSLFYEVMNLDNEILSIFCDKLKISGSFEDRNKKVAYIFSHFNDQEIKDNIKMAFQSKEFYYELIDLDDSIFIYLPFVFIVPQDLPKEKQADYLIRKYDFKEIQKVIDRIYTNSSFIEKMEMSLDGIFFAGIFDSLDVPYEYESRKDKLYYVGANYNLEKIKEVINEVGAGKNIKVKYCPECLSLTNKSDKFCSNCGFKFKDRKRFGIF